PYFFFFSRSAPLSTFSRVSSPARYDFSVDRISFMVKVLGALREALVWANVLPPFSFSPPGGFTGDGDRVRLALAARYGDVRRQLPPHVLYEASLTTLLLLPWGEEEEEAAEGGRGGGGPRRFFPPASSLFPGNGTAAAHPGLRRPRRRPTEVDDWIARSRAETARFDRAACAALTVYNRRKMWRRGECHIEVGGGRVEGRRVTSPEEHGCKSVWAPAFQVVPGWWETVVAGGGGGGRARNRGAGEREPKSPAVTEWLVEREITLISVFARRARCGAAAHAAPLGFAAALALAEKDMAARGLRRPAAPGVLPAGKSADAYRADALEGVRWLTEGRECVNGRKFEVCV
ncbi:MAG: hypothetical protein BJ554DRAFT_3074, partial [Olpidium bornovanus]